MSFRVRPVIDVQNGLVVHATGGDRRGYRPFPTSRVTTKPDPRAVVAAFRETFGFDEVYLADLDAITSGRGRSEILPRLLETGVRVLADLGLRDAVDLEAIPEPSADVSLILGSETLGGPESLGRILAANAARRSIFGLDLREGKPLISPGAVWGSNTPIEIVESAVAMGIRSILLLDLSKVGTNQGSGLIAMVESIARVDGSLEILVGGGIADIDEVIRWRDAGVAGVLVGSALHNGRIGPDDFKRLHS